MFICRVVFGLGFIGKTFTGWHRNTPAYKVAQKSNSQFVLSNYFREKLDQWHPVCNSLYWNSTNMQQTSNLNRNCIIKVLFAIGQVLTASQVCQLSFWPLKGKSIIWKTKCHIQIHVISIWFDFNLTKVLKPFFNALQW